MEIKGQIMYHFDNGEVSPDIWNEGNIFDNSYSYISNYYDKLMNSTTLTENDIDLVDVIEYYIKNEKSRKKAVELLRQAKDVITSIEMRNIEKVLEETREDYYRRLPSRKNSLFLCDEHNISYWQKKLEKTNSRLSLVKLSVTGEVFKSYDSLFPKPGTNLNELKKQARAYWIGKSDDKDDSYEYLFIGKSRVLKKEKIK